MGLGRILARILVAAFGLILGLGAATVTLAVAVYQLFGLPGLLDRPGPGIVIDGTFYVMFTWMAVGQFSIALALVAIVAAEILRIRSWLYYAAVGALSGAQALSAIETRFGGENAASMGAREAAAFIAAGLVGGLVYWLIAGRGAGILPERKGRADADAASPSPR